MSSQSRVRLVETICGGCDHRIPVSIVVVAVVIRVVIVNWSVAAADIVADGRPYVVSMSVVE